jgi:tetratricopeptide (TPR) repeat protein
LQRALDQAPGDAELVRQLAAVASDAEEPREAGRLLRTLPDGDLGFDDLLSLASASLQAGESESGRLALELVDRALVLRPAHPRAQLARARCLKALGRDSEARAALETLQREPRRPFGAAFELAELYRREGRADEARKLLAEHQAAQQEREELRRAGLALMRSPDDAEAHAQVGRLCLERGMYGRAIVELERSLKLDPDQPELRALLARARSEADRRPGADD